MMMAMERGVDRIDALRPGGNACCLEMTAGDFRTPLASTHVSRGGGCQHRSVEALAGLCKVPQPGCSASCRATESREVLGEAANC